MSEPDTTKPSLEIRLKRLIYRANYRGFKEADILLGGFTKIYGSELSEGEITELENLLEEYDHNIYDWLTGQKPLPAQYDTPLFARIKAFNPLDHLPADQSAKD